MNKKLLVAKILLSSIIIIRFLETKADYPVWEEGQDHDCFNKILKKHLWSFSKTHDDFNKEYAKYENSAQGREDLKRYTKEIDEQKIIQADQAEIAIAQADELKKNLDISQKKKAEKEEAITAISNIALRVGQELVEQEKAKNIKAVQNLFSTLEDIAIAQEQEEQAQADQAEIAIAQADDLKESMNISQKKKDEKEEATNAISNIASRVGQELVEQEKVKNIKAARGLFSTLEDIATAQKEEAKNSNILGNILPDYGQKLLNPIKKQVNNYLAPSIKKQDSQDLNIYYKTISILADALKEYESTPRGKVYCKISEEDSKIQAELAANGGGMQYLLEKKNILEDKTFLTTNDKKEKIKIMNALYSDKAFDRMKQMPELQEQLKYEILDLSEAQNTLTYKEYQAKLEDFGANLPKYLNKEKNFSKLQKPGTPITNNLFTSCQSIKEVIRKRMGKIFSGIASGGEAANAYGVWVKGMITRGKQKAYSNNTGFKFDQTGFTIGADTGDEFLIGLAYSFAENNIKDKENNGDKDKISSHTATLYGKYMLTDQFFVDGQMQYGNSYIKKQRASGDLDNHIAYAKTKAKTLSAKTEIGYDYRINSNIQVTSTIGLTHTDIRVKGYKERGDGLNIENVSKRSITRTSGIAGVSSQYLIRKNSINLIPEIHANIDYALNNKGSKTLVTIVGGVDPIVVPSDKPTRVYYNIGTSLKAIRSNKYEISVEYDLALAKKFKSHTGILKLRVNL